MKFMSKSPSILQRVAFVFLCSLLVSIEVIPAAMASESTRAKLGVLRFAGPKIFDIDADEVWKMKNSTNVPSEGELSKINDALQASLTGKLKDRLGATVVSEAELKKAEQSVPPSVGSKGYSPELAKKVGAKYFVSGSIDRVEFDGNTILPDIYTLFITTKLVDTESGKTVWQMDSRKFSSKTNTRKSGKSVAEVFTESKVPDLATELSSKIAGALNR